LLDVQAKFLEVFNRAIGLLLSFIPTTSTIATNSNGFNEVVFEAGTERQFGVAWTGEFGVLAKVENFATHPTDEVIVRCGGGLDATTTVVRADVTQHLVIDEGVDVLVNRRQ